MWEFLPGVVVYSQAEADAPLWVQASLVYRASSSTVLALVKDTLRNSIPKNKNQTKKSVRIYIWLIKTLGVSNNSQVPTLLKKEKGRPKNLNQTKPNSYLLKRWKTVTNFENYTSEWTKPPVNKVFHFLENHVLM